jgi:anti-sigma B factor antagonist
MFASPLDSEPDGVIRVVRETGGIVAVCLRGEFDLASVPALRETIDRALACGDNLIVDLSQVTFIDCSVIGALVDGKDAADGCDRTIVLQLGEAAMVERILELAEIGRALSMARDREEAVQITTQTQAPLAGRHHDLGTAGPAERSSGCARSASGEVADPGGPGERRSFPRASTSRRRPLFGGL